MTERVGVLLVLLVVAVVLQSTTLDAQSLQVLAWVVAVAAVGRLVVEAIGMFPVSRNARLRTTSSTPSAIRVLQTGGFTLLRASITTAAKPEPPSSPGAVLRSGGFSLFRRSPEATSARTEMDA